MNKYKIPLAVNLIGEEEIESVLNCLRNEKTTMDTTVKEFENKFAEYIDCKHSLMINSGSSANLLAMSILSNPITEKIKPGDEVIVPAVSWSTTVFPIIQQGSTPVFVDCDEDYQIDVNKIEEVITEKTKAMMIVHVLGNVCEMKDIVRMCKDNNLFLIEDSCEALGSKYSGKSVGTFGNFGTFSFYFTHHISTIEGGMLTTNDSDLYDIAKVMRSHGYARHSMKLEDYKRCFPEIDSRFMFVNLGYNFRPIELQAAIGMVQLEKLNAYLDTRIRNANKIVDALQQYKDYLLIPKKKPDTTHSWFAFPLTVKDNKLFRRIDLIQFLEKNGIETRPLIAGNIVEQPIFQSHAVKYKNTDLTNAQLVMRNSFYIGNHHKIDADYIIGVFDDFFRAYNK